MQDFHREYLAFLSIQKEGLHRISNPESSSNFKFKEFALNSAVIIESRFPRARHFPESTGAYTERRWLLRLLSIKLSGGELYPLKASAS